MHAHTHKGKKVRFGNTKTLYNFYTEMSKTLYEDTKTSYVKDSPSQVLKHLK